MIAVAEETKICGECGDELPLGRFRRRGKNTEKRNSDCMDCHAKCMRRLRAKGKSRAIRAFASEARNEASLKRIVGLCEGMFKRFQGVGGFVKALFREIDYAREHHPGSHRVINSMSALVNIAYRSQQSQPVIPTAAALSDEQLAEQVETLILELVQKQPEIVLMAAEQLGCRVEWPALVTSE